MADDTVEIESESSRMAHCDLVLHVHNDEHSEVKNQKFWSAFDFYLLVNLIINAVLSIRFW
jgi:hypothetical protein